MTEMLRAVSVTEVPMEEVVDVATDGVAPLGPLPQTIGVMDDRLGPDSKIMNFQLSRRNQNNDFSYGYILSYSGVVTSNYLSAFELV
jgi:hypothetical protein